MRAGISDGLLKGAGELLRGVDAARCHAEPGGELDEIEVRIRQVEQRLSFATGVLRAGSCQLGAEDPVGAVVEDHNGDLEPFARHRPERLDRVQSRAIGLECDDRPIGARDRRADRDRQSLTDRAPGQREPVMPRRPRSIGWQGAS